jgi:hypothetical protein
LFSAGEELFTRSLDDGPGADGLGAALLGEGIRTACTGNYENEVTSKWNNWF